MVADVIAAEVLAKLEGVVPMRPRKVIDELVLRNVTALREGSCEAIWAGKVVNTRILVEGFLIIKRCGRQGCSELSYVVAEGGRKGVGLGRPKDVGFRHLRIPARLQGVGIKARVERVQVSRLQSVIQLVAAKDIVVVSELLVHTR